MLAFSAIRNNDKVGLILFSDQVEKYVPPGKGRGHVLRVVREILYLRPGHTGTDIPRALDFVNHVTRRRAVVFLISDFQTSGEQERYLAHLRLAVRLTSKRHDLVALHVADPREAELPDVGLLTLEDAETGELIELNTGSKSVRDTLAELSAAERSRLQRLFRKEGVDELELDTSRPYLPAILDFFRTRERRRR